MKMNVKQKERWARLREMGRRRYIWIHGVLGWGVSVAIAWSVSIAWDEGWDRLPILLPIALVLFPFGGYFFGAIMWRMMEWMAGRNEQPEASR